MFSEKTLSSWSLGHLVTNQPHPKMKLPASVQEIAEVIGRERALYLIGQLPRFQRFDPVRGVRVGEQVILYVPRTLKPDHPLVAILGWHDAMRMVRVFGGELLKPAPCSAIYKEFRDQNIRRLLGEGVPAGMVAQWFGITQRHFRNIAQENQQEAPKAAANDNRANFSTRESGAA